MRASLKLTSFIFWVFSFTFAQGQECNGKDIKLENILPLEKAIFADGDTVKIICITGYIGFYKYKCSEGTWVQTHERKCTPKKCGHPGDAQNGDFTLLDGKTEFVFGATVQYSCKKGYNMANRVYQRTCRDNGWDNIIPVCEVVKCPPIPTVEDLIISGNAEEGTYGDVIQFECESSNKKIDREENDIHCNEKGEWSLPVPKCIVITCTAPDIPHGTVESNKVYNKDETLQYDCDKGYKARQGTPRCNKYGWSLKPECEEITCELKDVKYGIQNIIPEGKTFFRAGETVRITCSERYMLFSTKESTKTFHCQNDGQWDSLPTCVDIRCEIPRDSRIYYPSYSFYGEMKLDAKRSYRCNSGYRQMAEMATCTRDGWIPDPLCAEVTCEAPNIPNAKIVSPAQTKYDVNSKVEFKCLPGFEPEQLIRMTCNSAGKWINKQDCVVKEGSCITPTLENGHIDRNPPTEDSIFYSCDTGYKTVSGFWWGAATCNNSRWSNEQQCIQEDKCGVLPIVLHGHLKETIAGQSAVIVCDPGYKSLNQSIKCDKGTWETITCEVDEEGCDSPQRVENAVILSKPQERYSSGSHVIYRCHGNVKMRGERKVHCQNAVWGEAPTCEAFCSKPLLKVNNAKLTDEIQDERKYSHGDTVRYECDDGYESMGETIAKCDMYTWIYPECIKKAQCAKLTVNLRFVTLLDEKNLYNNFDTLTYKCNKPYDKIPGGTLMCKNEKWIGTIDCTSSTCPPPPLIEHGDYNTDSKIDEIITKVSYSCQSYYVLDKTQRFYMCRDGKWPTPPKCLKPCEFTPEIYKEYNIETQREKYVRHSKERFTLNCEHGWMVGGSRGKYTVTVSCSDGKMTIDNKCDERY